VAIEWHVVWRTADGNHIDTPIPAGSSEEAVRALFTEVLREHPVEQLIGVTIIGSADEKLLTERVLDTVVRARRTGTRSLEIQAGRIDLRSELFVNESYWRSVCKIAFHYVLKHIEFARGDEHEFRAIRDFIRHGRGRQEDFVSFPNYQPIANFEGARPGVWCHFLIALVRPDDIFVNCLFFIGPERLHRGVQVRLGGNPRRLILPEEQFAHAFVYDKELAGRHYDGVLRQLTLSTVRPV
jgi:hypothetical protein